MRLLISRHGDPDYAIDSLTPTGWREAELLARRLKDLDVKAFYVSPLGRARDTAKPTLEAMGRSAEVKDWLREFPFNFVKYGKNKCCWDWIPSEWTVREEFYDRDRWMDAPEFCEIGVREGYKKVTDGLDELLESHGYRREGGYYRAVSPNTDTVVLFCHFGLECVLLSHLLGVSPMVLWHGFCAAPSSVTTIYTEERRSGIAAFRISQFGDTSHLYVEGLEPSFSARFCETYDNWAQRHD